MQESQDSKTTQERIAENSLLDFVMDQVRANPEDEYWKQMLVQYVRADITCRTNKAALCNMRAYVDMFSPVIVPFLNDRVMPILEKMIDSGAYTPIALAEFAAKLATLKDFDKHAQVVSAVFRSQPNVVANPEL